MRSLLSTEPGGPESLVLRDIEEPNPTPGAVVIDVRACGVNFPDSLIIRDLYQFKPERPFAPGGEVSGVVAAIGPGVETLRPGQRVLAMTGWGGMAERIAVAIERCVPIPDTMPFDEAAAFMMTYGTTYHALHDRAQLKSGETLLVLGAAGGVGLAAIELGKAVGARVVAAASSLEKVALAKSRGADDVIVYPVGPFDRGDVKRIAEMFKSLCGRDGADVVYDPVGGDYSEAALRSIAWEGRYLVVGFPAGIPKIPLNLVLLKGCQVIGVFWGEFVHRAPKQQAANTKALFDLYARGAIKPIISDRFPLARAGDAIAKLAERKALGKIVVTMD